MYVMDIFTTNLKNKAEKIIIYQKNRENNFKNIQSHPKKILIGYTCIKNVINVKFMLCIKDLQTHIFYSKFQFVNCCCVVS